MSARTILLIITVLLAASAIATDVRLEHAQQLRYRTLEGVSDVHQYMKVRSRLPGVSPEHIVITIKAATGDIVLHPDAAGLVELPVSDALVKENPRIMTNQPDGSIRVSSAVTIWREGRAQLGHADFTELVAARARYLAVAGFLKRAQAPDAHGLLLDFPEGPPSSVTVTRHGVAENIPVIDRKARVAVAEADEDAELRIDSVIAPERVHLWLD